MGGTVRLPRGISLQPCFDEPLVVVVLADDTDLVRDEVCAVEADAEPVGDGDCMSRLHRQGERQAEHTQG